jgi:hypothetical protein
MKALRCTGQLVINQLADLSPCQADNEHLKGLLRRKPVETSVMSSRSSIKGLLVGSLKSLLSAQKSAMPLGGQVLYNSHVVDRPAAPPATV